MSFNKNKSYAEVCGPGGKYKYIQNHKFYDNHYNEVTEGGEPVPGGEYTIFEKKKPAPVVQEVTEVKDYAGMSVDQMTQPIVAPEDDGLSELTRKELFEQLDRLGADKPEQNARKDDLVAMVRDELKAKDNEDDE